MSTPETEGPLSTVVNLRLVESAKDRLERVAVKLAERDLTRPNISDAARAAMGRGLPLLEAELGIEP